MDSVFVHSRKAVLPLVVQCASVISSTMALSGLLGAGYQRRCLIRCKAAASSGSCGVEGVWQQTGSKAADTVI